VACSFPRWRGDAAHDQPRRHRQAAAFDASDYKALVCVFMMAAMTTPTR
jgi:hypothetical protein